jgi:excisionase family DNA binding protein
VLGSCQKSLDVAPGAATSGGGRSICIPRNNNSAQEKGTRFRYRWEKIPKNYFGEMIMEIFDTDQLSELLRLSVKTVRQYLRDGRLMGRKVGKRWLVPESAVALNVTRIKKSWRMRYITVATAQKVNDPADVQAIEDSFDSYLRAIHDGDADAVAAFPTETMRLVLY